MKKALFFALFFFCMINLSFSQSRFFVQNKKESTKIKFKLINNLIIIPVEINGVKLSFLLDTGVSKPIIFDFHDTTDSLKIKKIDKINLRGLGEGESIEAYRSSGNVLKVGDAVKLKQDIFAIYDIEFDFAPRLGIAVHGILGYDLFKDLVVEINYSKKFIKLTEFNDYTYKNCSKCEQLNLEFYRNKPYVNAVSIIDKEEIPVKLLIDSGGSDALWLFEDELSGIKSSSKYFYDFIGYGLSGSIYGKRSKIEEFSLKSFKLNNANVAFPDSVYAIQAKTLKGRNGSLGGSILKRFNIIFNYKNATIMLKKNSFFKDKFRYNRSGIELAHNGLRLVKEIVENVARNDNKENNSQSINGIKINMEARYSIVLKPAYEIVELRKDSPANRVGLNKGDIILSINGKQAHDYSLQKIVSMFYGNIGDKIKLKVERDGRELLFTFLLEDVFN